MKTITVVGGNLFTLAATQLGDATQWVRIAQLNQINDPNIIGTLSLLIPNVDPNLTGGVVQQ